MKPKSYVDKSRIFSGEIFMEFPNLILDSKSSAIVVNIILDNFRLLKTVEKLYTLDKELGCDVILNVKKASDVIIE